MASVVQVSVSVLCICVAITHSKILIRPAGRQTYSLGKLYNAQDEEYNGRSVLKRELVGAWNEWIEHKTTLTRANAEISTNRQATDTQLSLDAHLQVSILSGMVDGSVGGSYVTEKYDSSHTVRGQLNFETRTVEREFNFCDPRAKRLYVDTWTNMQATHVIYKIAYGAQVVVKFEQTLQENEDKEQIAGNLEATMSRFAAIVEAKASGQVTYSTGKTQSDHKIKMEMSGDVTVSGLPMNEGQMTEFIETLPQALTFTNGIIGRPIEYHLIELSSIADCLDLTSSEYLVLNEIEQVLNQMVLAAYEDIRKSEVHVADIAAPVNDFHACLPEPVFSNFTSLVRAFYKESVKYRLALKQAVVQSRTEETTRSLQILFMEGAHSVNHTRAYEAVRSYYGEIKTTVLKLQVFKKKGFECVTRIFDTVNEITFVNQEFKVFLIAVNTTFDNADSQEILNNTSVFGPICSQEDRKCLVAFCQTVPKVCESIKLNSVYYFEKGVQIASNYQEYVDANHKDQTSAALIIESNIAKLQSQMNDVFYGIASHSQLLTNIVSSLNFKTEVLGRQLNYTHSFQQYVFRFILDDIISAEVIKKHRNNIINKGEILGGKRFTNFCYPQLFPIALKELNECRGTENIMGLHF